MAQNEINNEEKIYTQIMDLEDGDYSDKSLAIKCIGILGNESTKESFESRLNIVEKLIKEHTDKKQI